ncbi:MAG: GNAT family N-acetyltransferase [Alphaproteobacteria bacterium]|nr:GNAT family N-acetyltransferase [Alphaproteobacteria bacterium]
MNTVCFTFNILHESHLPLLLKWLKAAHVKAWWDQEIRWTPQLIKEKFGSYVQGYKLEKGVRKPFQAYVIYSDTQPVGYIQLYNAHDFPRDYPDGLEELPTSLAAIDVFIGEKDFLGKGLGPHILTQFLHEHVDPYYDACFVDPDTANVRAIGAYEKAGFIRINLIEEGRVTWMMRESKNEF